MNFTRRHLLGAAAAALAPLGLPAVSPGVAQPARSA